MRRYSTGRFARRASVSVRTLRYYDRAGVLVPSARTEAGLSSWWQQHNQLPEGEQPMRMLYTPEEQAFMNAALAAARQR